MEHFRLILITLACPMPFSKKFIFIMKSMLLAVLPTLSSFTTSSVK